MTARVISRARVRPRTTLPVGRPQNTRTRAATATAAMRRARLLAPTQVPPGPVRGPAGPRPAPLGPPGQPADGVVEALAGPDRGHRLAGQERPTRHHQGQD